MAKRKKKNPVVEKKKILVVDDQPALLQSMAEHLVDAGYQVVTALDGHEALRKAAERPDLIVLDDLVSPMHYIDVLLRLQADCTWPTASIPVIMVAEEPQSRDVIRVPYHWDCWLTKPVDPSELRLYIGRIFDAIDCHTPL